MGLLVAVCHDGNHSTLVINLKKDAWWRFCDFSPHNIWRSEEQNLVANCLRTLIHSLLVNQQKKQS